MRFLYFSVPLPPNTVSSHCLTCSAVQKVRRDAQNCPRRLSDLFPRLNGNMWAAATTWFLRIFILHIYDTFGEALMAVLLRRFLHFCIICVLFAGMMISCSLSLWTFVQGLPSRNFRRGTSNSLLRDNHLYLLIKSVSESCVMDRVYQNI